MYDIMSAQDQALKIGKGHKDSDFVQQKMSRTHYLLSHQGKAPKLPAHLPHEL